MMLFRWLLIKRNPEQVTILSFPICKVGTVRPNAAVIPIIISKFTVPFFCKNILSATFNTRKFQLIKEIGQSPAIHCNEI